MDNTLKRRGRWICGRPKRDKTAKHASKVKGRSQGPFPCQQSFSNKSPGWPATPIFFSLLESLCLPSPTIKIVCFQSVKMQALTKERILDHLNPWTLQLTYSNNQIPSETIKTKSTTASTGTFSMTTSQSQCTQCKRTENKLFLSKCMSCERAFHNKCLPLRESFHAVVCADCSNPKRLVDIIDRQQKKIDLILSELENSETLLRVYKAQRDACMEMLDRVLSSIEDVEGPVTSHEQSKAS